MLMFDVDRMEVVAAPETAVVAGWTGRDTAGVEHHIEELARIGIARPSAMPLYYRIAASLLTQGDLIEVVGAETSGEAEPVVVDTPEGPILTLGSDHTDRALEAYSVALSKQACAKPLARVGWRLGAVSDRLDEITLRSWVSDDGRDWHPYQDGTLAAIRPLGELLAAAPTGAGRVVLCGTVPTLGGAVIVAPWFRAEMALDDRRVALAYRATALPVIE